MPADLTWSLSGVDARRWRIQASSSGRAPVSMRSTRLVVPGRHGSIAPGLPVYDEPTITLVLQPLGDQAALEEAQAELLGLLSAPGLTVTRSSGGVTASAPARLEKVEPQVFVAGVLTRMAVTISVPSVFLRGAEMDSTLTVSGAVPGLTGSTAPVGDAVLRVRGPNAFTMTDVVSGTGISWVGALDDSWYLFVDAASMRSWLSSSGGAWSGGSGGSTVVRTNLHTNPRYIGPDGTGGGGSASWSQVDIPSGGPDGRGFTGFTVVGTQSGPVDIGNDEQVPVTPGVVYTLQTHASMTNITQLNVQALAIWLDAGGAVIGSDTGTVTNAAANGWRQYAVVGVTAPAGAASVQVRLRISPAAYTLTTGNLVNIGLRMVERTAVLLPYGDGGTTGQGFGTWTWTGAANASTSILTAGPSVTSALNYPPAGRLQLWPRMPSSNPAERTARVTFSGASEVVVRAQPAYL